MRAHFRDAKEWKDAGLQITGASDEVCKVYDAVISNLISWGYENSMGDMSEISGKLENISSDCVLVQALFLGMSLMDGKTVFDDAKVKESVDKFMELVDRQNNDLTDREKSHVAAVKHISEGNIDGALLEWDHIITDYPTDLHAVFFFFMMAFSVGGSKEMMDMTTRVAPYFNENIPLHEYINGIHSFSCEEAGYYDMAEKLALKGIERFPNDTFSYHSMAHICEMNRRLEEGKKFMEKTYDAWKPAVSMTCHNVWHNCLFYVENCEYEAAIEIYDAKLKKFLTPDNFLAYSDAASLFYRLKMAGFDVGRERWQELDSITDNYIGTMRPFNASHVILSTLSNNDKERSDKVLQNIYNKAKLNTGFSSDLTGKVGSALMDGIVKFHNQEYDDAVDVLRPIRHQIYRIGGSHAQRDVYQQIICYAALNSTTKHNQNYARQILAERQATMSGPLTDKMANRLLAFHYANE